MSDAGFNQNVVAPPSPWGDRPLGVGAGLQEPPHEPKLTPMSNMETRVSRLETGLFGTAAFLLLVFGAGFVLLFNQINSGFDRLATKADAISTQVSGVETDVAVLAERTRPEASKDR